MVANNYGPMVVNDHGPLFVNDYGPMTANDCEPIPVNYCGPMPASGYGPIFMGHCWTIAHLDGGPKTATAIGPEKSTVLYQQGSKTACCLCFFTRRRL